MDRIAASPWIEFPLKIEILTDDLRDISSPSKCQNKTLQWALNFSQTAISRADIYNCRAGFI
jgi:hypothetical protein